MGCSSWGRNEKDTTENQHFNKTPMCLICSIMLEKRVPGGPFSPGHPTPSHPGCILRTKTRALPATPTILPWTNLLCLESRRLWLLPRAAHHGDPLQFQSL